ncbi:hypothetical protein E1171_11485 [Cytophagales bacterium RKSG123]|nr:hypothetical protein [Xanthovirga aplysinae]
MLEMETLMKEFFDLEEIEFHKGDEIVPHDVFSKRVEAVKLNYPPADLYFNISGAISLPSILYKKGVEVQDYLLTLKFYGEDRDGRRVFKKKTVIPFRPIPGKGIYGPFIIGKEDFHQMFSDAVKAIFSVEEVKFGKRLIKRPVNEKYKEFLQATDLYQLEERHKNGWFKSDNSYLIKAAESSNAKSIELTPERLKESGLQVDKEFKKDKYFRFFRMDNQLQSDQYNVLVSSNSSSELDFLEVNPQQTAVTFKSSSGTIGGFTFVEHFMDSSSLIAFRACIKEYQESSGRSFGLLLGKLENQNYGVLYNATSQLAEIYRDDVLVAVVQESQMSQLHRRNSFAYTVHVKNSLGQKELGDVMNVYLAYEIAYSVEMDKLE